MRRVIGLFILLYCAFAFVVSAAPLDMAAVASELGKVQAGENMKIGVYAVPETVINAYFAAIAADNPQIKDSAIAIHNNNKIIITTTAEKVGTIRLTCTIKQFHFDQNTAALRLHIDKKELLGHSIASWFINQMSVGFITELYGNPLAQANIGSKVDGNTVDIDLEPFAAGLFKTGIGQSLGSAFEIAGVTTDNGVLYLHTNISVSVLSQS